MSWTRIAVSLFSGRSPILLASPGEKGSDGAAVRPLPRGENPVKVLCICTYGHSRSVALTRILHELKHPAVAIGYSTSGDAAVPLSQWADVIALLSPEARCCIPAEHARKIVDFNVGPDRWSNPYNQELLGILGKMVADYLAEKTR